MDSITIFVDLVLPVLFLLGVLNSLFLVLEEVSVLFLGTFKELLNHISVVIHLITLCIFLLVFRNDRLVVCSIALHHHGVRGEQICFFLLVRRTVLVVHRVIVRFLC